MDATVHQTSTRFAVMTFVVLFGLPIAVFAMVTFAMLKSGITSPGWGPLLAVYALGTLPGLILGVRYLSGAAARCLFGVAYLLVCAGLLFVVLLSIGCWLTKVCL